LPLGERKAFSNILWGVTASVLPWPILRSTSFASTGDSLASRIDAPATMASQCQLSDGKGLRTCHCLFPGLHSFHRRFTFIPPLNELSPFLTFWVDGIEDGYLAPPVSKHAPTRKVSSLCLNPVHNVLVPPSERVLNPRIFTVHKPHDDGLVEGAVVEAIVLHTPASFRG